MPRSLTKHPEYIALDSREVAPFYAYANQNACGLGFPGYSYLSELVQRSEYRAPSETIANEMTRKWIKIKGKGDGDHSDRIEKIEKAFKEFGIQESFRTIAEKEGFFGRMQLMICIEGQMDKKRELPLLISPATIRKGSVLGFKPIEPIWTTPYTYNAIDPSAPDFFKPIAWFVMGKRTHASRLLTFISREVPDLLKPSFNFGGISMSQLMEPYVNQWLRTRDSISDLIHNFSVLVLKTNLQATLENGMSEELFKRIMLFTQTRDNRGLMAVDKDSEELEQIAVPLSGLEGLQAQAQEHMAAPSHIPLVKLLGITPGGLNTSTEGEIQVFYDYVKAMQESLFADHLTTVLKIVQLHLFGSIDENIGFEFVPLKEMSEKELAEIRKSDADSAQTYVNIGAIDADEVREKLSSDPSSGYDNLTGDAPGPPELDTMDKQHELGEESADNAHERGEQSAENAHNRELTAPSKKD